MLSHRDEINERLLRVVDAAVGTVGRQGQPHRDQGHRPAREPRAVDGPADEGGTREARRDPRGRRPAPVGDPQGRGPEAVADPRSRRAGAKRRSATPRRASGSAQAEAKATEMVSEAVARGDVASLNYFVAQKYLEAFGKLAQSPNQKVLILPMEATSVLGSLAGIGEIAKATFGSDGSGGGGGKTVPRRRASRADRRRPASPPPATRRRHERAMPMLIDYLVAFGNWNWLILAAIFFVIELLAPGVFMLWLGLSACWSAIISLVRRLAVAVPAHRLRGVRARLDPAVAALRAPRRGTGRSAVPQPPRRCLRRAACSRWRSRSSPAPARCGSTTRSGGSPARTRRPAAASRSCARMRRPAGGGAGVASAHALRAADRAGARCRPACRLSTTISAVILR